VISRLFTDPVVASRVIDVTAYRREEEVAA
jgi:hypothetical protein